MYLISLYFDEGTNKKIQLYMEQIAQRTGNMEMIDGKVPPHITLSAFDMAEEEKALNNYSLRIVRNEEQVSKNRNLKKDRFSGAR